MGLPPTTTKGSGDSTPQTTFEIDAPNIPITHSGTKATIGTIPIAGGGTGQTSKAAAFDALSPLTTSGDMLVGGAAGTGTRLANGTTVTITVNINGGGTTPATGILSGADIRIPYAMTITGWYLMTDVSGSIVIDIWKAAFASFPPTVANTITGAAKPLISGAQTNSNTSLGAWSTGVNVSAGDVLRFNIDSASTITYATLNLVGVRV